MPQRTFLILFTAFLLNACAHGPSVEYCVSDPENAAFVCPTREIAYKASQGLRAYSLPSFQHMIAFCAARNQDGVQAPYFSSCVSDPAAGGFQCKIQNCELNPQHNGASCAPAAPFFVYYDDSEHFIASSEADDLTVLSYCNIKTKE